MTSSTPRLAQVFTTGSNQAGYALSSIGMGFGTLLFPLTAGDDLAVGLWSVSGGIPDSELCELADPASFTEPGVYTFTAPTAGTDACPTLEPGTDYAAVLTLAGDVADSHVIGLYQTSSDEEDTLSIDPTWSIADQRSVYTSSADAWSTGGSALQIEVDGALVGTSVDVVENRPASPTCKREAEHHGNIDHPVFFGDTPLRFGPLPRIHLRRDPQR